MLDFSTLQEFLTFFRAQSVRRLRAIPRSLLVAVFLPSELWVGKHSAKSLVRGGS